MHVRQFVWKEVVRALKDVRKACESFVTTTVEFLRQIATLAFVVILPTVFVALVIVALYFMLYGWHELVYDTSPDIYKAGHDVEKAIDGSEDAIDQLIKAGSSVANVVSFGHAHVHAKELTPVKFHIDEFEDPKVTCHKYTEGDYIALLVFKYMASKHTCYILRFFWGTWLHGLIEPFVGWLSWDSEPYPGNNCKSPGDTVSFCLAANAELVLVEVILVLAVVTLVLVYIKPIFWLGAALAWLVLIPLALLVAAIREYAHRSLSYT